MVHGSIKNNDHVVRLVRSYEQVASCLSNTTNNMIAKLHQLEAIIRTLQTQVCRTPLVKNNPKGHAMQVTTCSLELA